MAEINLNSLSAALDNVPGSGVSFEDKTKNWGTKDEGISFSCFYFLLGN